MVNRVIRERDSLLRNLDFQKHDSDEDREGGANNGRSSNGLGGLIEASEDADGSNHHRRANRQRINSINEN